MSYKTDFENLKWRFQHICRCVSPGERENRARSSQSLKIRLAFVRDASNDVCRFLRIEVCLFFDTPKAVSDAIHPKQGSFFRMKLRYCCSHINSRNQIRGHRTGFSHSGAEEYPREKHIQPKMVHAYTTADAIHASTRNIRVRSGVSLRCYI